MLKVARGGFRQLQSWTQHFQMMGQRASNVLSIKIEITSIMEPLLQWVYTHPFMILWLIVPLWFQIAK